MAFNLLRALLILQLQVATGKIARRGCSRGHFWGPRRQVRADDRYRRTPQDLQYSGAPTTGQVISTQNTQRNVHLLCSHLAQKNDRLSVFVKSFSAQR